MPRLEPFPDPHNDYRTPELSAIFGKIVKDALESTLLESFVAYVISPHLQQNHSGKEMIQNPDPLYISN